MRCLVVSCVYPPEPMVSGRTSADIVEELSARGHHIMVISPFPNRPSGSMYKGIPRKFVSVFQQRGNVTLVRCASFFSKSSRTASRFLENITFGLFAGLMVMFVRKPAVIYSNTWPILATGILAVIARCRRIPLVISVQDLYPESLIIQGRVRPSGWVSRILRWLDGAIVRQCRAVIVISRLLHKIYTADRMVKHCPVSIVPNWIDPRSLVMDHDRSLRYRASLGIPPDAFVCAFAGNIGTAAGVEQVIEAFDHLFERQDLWLIIAGQGSRLAACQALAARTKSLHIHFHTPYPREQEALLLGAADLLLLPTRGEQTKVSVPSKLLTYMLAGQPVGAMAVSQSELADIVREAQCGWVVDPDRPELVAQSIRNFAGLPSDERREIGERGRRYLLRNFTKKRLLPKAIRIIEAATRKGPLCTVPFVEGDCGLRPMCEKDLPAVVRVHLGSFTDFFLSSLGPVFLRELYAGTITDPSGIAIVADVKHAIGGFVTGTTAPAGFFKRLLRERWWRFAIACIMPTIRRPWIVLRLMRALNMHTKSRGGLARGVLMSLAVSPEAQGKGIGRALVKAFLKEAALRGVQRVELTTDATGNTPVNRFYRDLGFNHKRRFTTPEGRQMNAYTIDIKI